MLHWVDSEVPGVDDGVAGGCCEAGEAAKAGEPAPEQVYI